MNHIDNFGERLSKLLSLRGMSQRELAEKIGVSEVSISRYVHENRIPIGARISKIAGALNTTTDYLLNRDDTKDPEIEYLKVTQSIRNYAKCWNKEQKANLVNTIFEI